MFKSLIENHSTINHMIIFNLSISKFYQCSMSGFHPGISMFFSICLGKKNAEVTKFLRTLKRYVFGNKIYFCLRKKSNVSLKGSLSGLRQILAIESHLKMMKSYFYFTSQALSSHVTKQLD